MVMYVNDNITSPRYCCHKLFFYFSFSLFILIFLTIDNQVDDRETPASSPFVFCAMLCRANPRTGPPSYAVRDLELVWELERSWFGS